MSVERVLATERMSATPYRELPPARDLARVVACRWVRVATRDSEPLSVTVVPDGCTDVITVDHGAPMLVGPDTGAYTFALHSGIVITGLRLRPGALRGVAGCRAEEVLDTSVPLRDIDRSALGLESHLHRADTLDGRFAALEQWVRDRMRVTVHDSAVMHACRILATRGASNIDHVATSLGWSVRTLRREFVSACGYGPKVMHRILRVQRAVRRSHRTPGGLGISALAADLGFADHAHMTREFRAILGVTPTEYLGQADPALSRWLDRDWPTGLA
jgi:AraC-like DNA-binding protein